MKDDLTKKASLWINSKKGKKALKDAAERAEKQIEYMRKAREVDPITLLYPMTI